MKMSTGQTLLRRAQQFDQQALAEVYDQFSPGVYRYAMRLLGDANLAEDCVAETFSRFLKAIRVGRGPQDHLQAYLYRIAHNWITDYYRRRTPPELPLEPEVKSDEQEEPHQVIAGKMERQQMRTALAFLTPDQRQVILLKYLEDWSNNEIAHALQKPVGAVKALQHRALQSLRRILSKQEEVL